MEVLSDEEVKYFIKLVSQYPCLYNCKSPHYKEGRVRDNVWQEIAQEIKITSDNCKRQWKTIRDGYMRYRRRSNLPIGSEVPKTKRTKWKLYRLLSFLDNVPHERYSFGSKDESESSQYCAEEDYAEETLDSALNNIKQESHDMREDNKQQKNAGTDIEQVYIPVPQTAEHPMRIKKRQQSGRGHISAKKMRENTQPLKNVSEGTDDEFKSFAKYTEEVLKNLPTKLLQVKAKREIFDVLSKYEVLAAENSVPCSPTTSHGLYQSTAGHRSPLVSTLLAPTPSSSEYVTAMASGSECDSDDQ